MVNFTSPCVSYVSTNGHVCVCVCERTMIFSEEFSEICINLTDSERTELALRWGDDTETIILILDDVRENLLIRSILQV